jgi:hypothetical protein
VERFANWIKNPRREGVPSSRLARCGGAAVVALACSITLVACANDSANVAHDGSLATTTTASANESNATNSSDTLAFAQCMRTNRVPNFPDPNASGALPKESPQQLGVSDTVFRAAEHSCQHLLPNGGAGPDQAEIARVKALGLQFAQCMRSHGVALPDPGSDGRIPDPSTVGINQGSPKFQAANQACGKYRPPYMPSNAEYNAYEQSQGS